MNTPNIYINDFTYNLPNEKIAKFPLPSRSDSKLLMFKKNISEYKFSQLPELLPKNSLIVFNNTKVIQARIPFHKETGAKIEIFCLEPHLPSDLNLAFQATNQCKWKCIIGNSKKWKQGKLTKEITTGNSCIELTIERTDTIDNAQIIEFKWNDESINFGELLEAIGNIPIPPYLNRESESIDTFRYQTVYSHHKGSVAAPTAGLHFTPDILSELEKKEITLSNITLHVGAGTFKPVKTEDIAGHEMHIENFFVEENTIDLLLQYENNITSTGTTTVRTLESLYWLGVKLLEGNNNFFINQWDPYNLPQHYSLNESLERLKKHLFDNNTSILESSTGVLIAPGYKFRVVNRLITNFHQPTSTLLLLVSAFTKGNVWKDIYNHALNNNFRFLSYGDSSLLYRSDE